MTNVEWMDVLAQLTETYGEECALRLAGRNGIAVRMIDTDWMVGFAQLMVTHGEVEAIRLAGNSFYIHIFRTNPTSHTFRVALVFSRSHHIRTYQPVRHLDLGV